MSIPIPPISTRTCIVRNTAARKGRTQSVSPGSTAARYLHYGRIILDAGDTSLAISTRDRETGLIGLGGRASVLIDGASYSLGKYDALYVPRDASLRVAPGENGC